MRFVELRSSVDRAAFCLHPRITWLRGLAPAARVAIVGLVHDVALGEKPDWDGVVEADGTETSLKEAVSAFGETADSALIIDAASLPDLNSGTIAPAGDEANLEAAQAKLADLDERIAGLAGELAASGTVRTQMTGHLASVRSLVDDDASLRLDRADGDLGRAARLAQRPDPWTGMDDAADRIAVLCDRVEECDKILEGLPNGDRPALAAAVATARAAISTGPVPAPEAVALAQAWLALHQRLRGLESRMEAAGGGTEAVAARLEVARSAARAAEDAAVPRKITSTETSELECLQEITLQAEKKAGRGVRRSAARAAFDLAEADLHASLQRLGYPSWAAFRMGNGMIAVSAEDIAEYGRSQEDLEVAEVEWAQLMARIERDTDLQDVLAGTERALTHATELLGTNPYDEADDASYEIVAEALRAHTVDAASVGVSRDAGIGHLRDEMTASGAGGFEALTSDAALVALGDSWLGVLTVADDLAVRLLRDSERAGEELEALRALGDGTRVDRLGQERTVVRSAEDEVAECRAAMTEVVNARLQLHALASTELTLAEEHDDRLVQRQSAQVLVDLAARRLDGDSQGGAAVLADRVPRGIGGAIPVVVVMGDAPARTLDRLVALPEDVQILIIGACEDLDEWLTAAGPDVGSVVDAGTLV